MPSLLTHSLTHSLTHIYCAGPLFQALWTLWSVSVQGRSSPVLSERARGPAAFDFPFPAPSFEVLALSCCLLTHCAQFASDGCIWGHSWGRNNGVQGPLSLGRGLRGRGVQGVAGPITEGSPLHAVRSRGHIPCQSGPDKGKLSLGTRPGDAPVLCSLHGSPSDKERQKPRLRGSRTHGGTMCVTLPV